MCAFCGFLRRLQPIRIFLLIPEMQRISDRFCHFDRNKHATVKKTGKPVPRGDCHVMVTICANVQIGRQLAVEQHGAALGAFGPKILGDFPTREERVDRRADVVGNPVHRLSCGAFGSLRNSPRGQELQSPLAPLGQ